MKVELCGQTIHVATGGRVHVEGRPFIIFLHGAGNCHLTWVSQTRAMAYDGMNVIAPDLPGHNLSGGEAIGDIAGQAEWVLELMDTLGCGEAVVAGHSQGGLMALEMAKAAPDRVTGVVMIATAAAIAVNDKLIGLAEAAEDKAIGAMIDWAHGPGAHMHDNSWPGASLITYGEDVMALNREGTLPADLKSCAAYEGGAEAAKGLKCPALCIFAERDRMTPLKSGKALAQMIADSELHVLAGAGHMLPLERPRQVNRLLRTFLNKLDAQAAA